MGLWLTIDAGWRTVCVPSIYIQCIPHGTVSTRVHLFEYLYIPVLTTLATFAGRDISVGMIAQADVGIVAQTRSMERHFRAQSEHPHGRIRVTLRVMTV